MIKKLIFIIICLGYVNAAADPHNHQIVKINENVYQAKMADDLYFVIERSQSHAADNWYLYISKTIKKLEGITFKEFDAKYPKRGDLKSLLDVFKMFETAIDQENSDIWIASARSAPYKDIGEIHGKKDESLQWFKAIEMAFAVVISPNRTFQTHMGISRGIFYEGPAHKALAVPLHAFAAKAMQTAYPTIKMMITRPTGSMLVILLKAFENNPDAFWNGHDTAKKPWVIQHGDEMIVYKNSKEIYKGKFPLLTNINKGGPDFSKYFAVDIKALANSFK